MLVWLSLLSIAILDLIYHRISNNSLLALAAISMLEGDANYNFFEAAICFAIGLILYSRFGLGGGDVKLATLIVLLLLPRHELVNFTLYFSLISLISLALYRALKGTLRGRIPLAPMVCGALLCVQLFS